VQEGILVRRRKEHLSEAIRREGCQAEPKVILLSAVEVWQQSIFRPIEQGGAMCYAHCMELSASRRNKRLGDAPAAEAGRDGARGWRVWVAARPITLVSSFFYLAALFSILIGDCLECYVPWKGVLSVGLLLLLLLLDRLEYGLFGEMPPRRASLALLATRLALTLAISYGIGSWDNAYVLFMLAIIPYMGYLYFGSKGGIAVGVLVWLIAAVNLTMQAISHLTRVTTFKGGETFTEYMVTWSLVGAFVTSLATLTILIVFVLVSARIASLERAHTSQTERLLAQLETSHARLGVYSQRAIAGTEEHNKTARDIHDRLAHYLTAVSVQIDLALAYRDIGPEKAEGAIRSAKKAITRSLQDVRRSVAILRSKRELAYIPDDEPEDVQAIEAAPSDSVEAGGRGRLWWLAPRPFDVTTTTLYVGIFALGWAEEATTWPGDVLALAGLLLGLAALDRVEFAIFRGHLRFAHVRLMPAWWVGGLLLAARITIIAVLVEGVGIWAATLLVAIIPYWCTIYFGGRASYIAAALPVVLVGLLLLGEALEQMQSGSPDAALRDYLASLLQVAFVLGVVAATSRTVMKESAGRARAERVLGELRKAHADLAEFSRQALEVGEARNSLARDIHDGLGHYLTAMSVQLEKAIAFRSIDPATADQALNESKRLVAVALQEVRSTMGALRESEVESSPTKLLADLAK
jgi:signal transduction histidine kinase